LKVDFKKIRYKNFLSVGNAPVEIDLQSHPMTLIIGHNGKGKCLKRATEVDIRINNPDTEKLFQDFLIAKNYT
jgi:hypothetical protein